MWTWFKTLSRNLNCNCRQDLLLIVQFQLGLESGLGLETVRIFDPIDGVHFRVFDINCHGYAQSIIRSCQIPLSTKSNSNNQIEFHIQSILALSSFISSCTNRQYHNNLYAISFMGFLMLI